VRTELLCHMRLPERNGCSGHKDQQGCFCS
jgi:hypothetical protein